MDSTYGSTYSDLQSLQPIDLVKHIATRIEHYDPNDLGPDKGLVYTIYDFTGEPTEPGEPTKATEPLGDAIEVTALADDNTRRRFRIRVEPID